MDGDDVAPLDAADPRFSPDAASPRPPRRLERTHGPASSPPHPLAGRLQVAVRVVFAAGLALVAAVFLIGLDPGRPVVELGDADAVRTEVAAAPRRVCVESGQPCAWLSVVDGRLLALATAGPLREEHGRLGVVWCPASGAYVAANTRSTFDPLGRVRRGPAPRGLDRYRITVDGDRLRLDFTAATAGPLAAAGTRPAADRAPACRDAAGPVADLSVPVEAGG